jgi:iron complex outermembrane receptor protein
VKTYPFTFSRLHKALLAVGSFSCLGLSSVLVHAEDENKVSQLETITVNAQAEAYIFNQR